MIIQTTVSLPLILLLTSSKQSVKFHSVLCFLLGNSTASEVWLENSRAMVWLFSSQTFPVCYPNISQT